MSTKKSIKKVTKKNNNVRTKKKTTNNRKVAFTLIELLAVIIILGVLMLVAIPSVTTYINNSRKETYIDTARNLIRGATVLVNSGKLDVYDNDTYKYYWISRDEQGIGVDKITKVDSLSAKSIVAGIKKDSIKPNTVLGSRNTVKLLSEEDCLSFEDKPKVSRNIRIIVTWDVPNPVIGDTAHFHAQLTGYDNLSYTCQWQWSADQVTYHDIEGATSLDMDIVVNRQNNYWYWRILVNVDD